MNATKLLAALVVAALVVLFGVQNTQAVTFHVLQFTLPAFPLVLALFGATILGALLGWIVSAPSRYRHMRERHGLQREIAAHERADDARASQAS